MEPYLDDDTRPMKVPVFVQAVRACRPAIIRVLGPRMGETTLVPTDRRQGLVLGRGTAATLRLDDETVSREHCRISWEADGRALLTDLGSTNGTLVNGLRVTKVALSDGDKIQVGVASVFRYSLNDRMDENYVEHLYQLSIRDSLTGLHNRRYLLECLERDLALSRRHGMPLALVLLDADRFKEVNDSLGHAGGDDVLKGLAQLLSSMQRVESVLARYGGEEFAVLLRNVEPAGAEVFAERMRSAVEHARLAVGRAHVRMTVSLGVATTSADGSDAPARLVEAADRYLYLSKSRGRNCLTSARSFAP